MKVEMHAHTAEVSPCAYISAEGLIKAYAQVNYGAVVITDHFNDYVLEAFSGKSKRERVDAYLEGYERACEAGAKYGVQVWLGIESCLRGGLEDFLVYGIDRDFLYEHPQFYRYSQQKAYEFCRQAGVLFYQAHPYRSYCRPQNPDWLDGVEVYNGNSSHQNNNQKAAKWAKAHPHLRLSSGSDFHWMSDLGKGGLRISDETDSNQALLALMKAGKTELIQGRG